MELSLITTIFGRCIISWVDNGGVTNALNRACFLVPEVSWAFVTMQTPSSGQSNTCRFTGFLTKKVGCELFLKENSFNV